MQYPATPIAVFGGTYPASVWHDYTEAVLTGQPAIDFPTPDQSRIPAGKFITSDQLRLDSPNDTVPTVPTVPTPATATAPSTSVPTGTTVPTPSTTPTETTLRPPTTHPPTTCVTIVVATTTISICR